MSVLVRHIPSAPTPSRVGHATRAALHEWAIFASLVTITSSVAHVVPTLFAVYPLDLGIQMIWFGLVAFVVTIPLIAVIFVAVVATPPAPRGMLSRWRTMTRWGFYALAILLGSSAAFFPP